LNKELTDELKSIKEERAELYERLEPYERVKEDPLFNTPAPKISAAPENIRFRFAPEFKVGEKVLAKFSSTDYIASKLKEINDDSVIVEQEDGETEEIKKAHIFVSIEDLVDNLVKANQANQALQTRIDDMESQYQKHLEELEKEMKNVKEDNDSLFLLIYFI